MGTIGRRLALVVALAAIVAAGCAKGETAATPTTAAPSSGPAGTEAPPAACPILEEIHEGEVGKDLTLLVDRFVAARDASPEELHDDWDRLLPPFRLLASVDPTDPDYLAKLTEFTELGQDPAYGESLQAVTDFARDSCGIDLNIRPTGSGSGSSGSSTSRASTSTTTAP